MTSLRTRLTRIADRARPSRIGLRLLAFNVLLVFLPVSGLLYLDVYESQLLDLQERGMVQQAHLVAAAVGGDEVRPDSEVSALVARFGQRGDARIRIYDASGRLKADSARQSERRSVEDSVSEYSPSAGVRQRALYRAGAWLARLRSFAARTLASVWPSRLGSKAANASLESGPPSEVRAALAGRYGAAVRPTPGQRSLTMFSAVPVRVGTGVAGAVVVSQTTFRILQALYDVRLRLFEIVVWSMAVALGLAVLTSATIVRPLVRLRRAAVALIDRRATPADFRVDRKDEIGDLARALEELTTRLDAHIRLLESFAGDIAHEFKNPLASIRAAAEILASTDEAPERERLLALVFADVNRLERLVSGVRELARIDTELARDTAPIVDLGAFVRRVVDGFRLREPRASLALDTEPGRRDVRAGDDRLAQVLENVIENALGFAPAQSVVDISVRTRDGQHEVVIADRGPGFPPAHLERVFERFFSYRPGSAGGEHMGLGLAIARAIVEGYAGSIRAENRDGGGAIVTIALPAS